MNFDRINRLPKCGQLEPSNRQQMRRLTISPGTCCRCGQKLQVWQHPCFDDGHDAHADCSLSRNAEIRKAARIFATQDADELGTVRPCQPLSRLSPLSRLKPLPRRNRPLPVAS